MLLSKLNKNEKKAVIEFKSNLLSKLGKEVVSIRLFGSKARGDFRKDSDIDILVVLKDPKEDEIDYIYDLAMSLDIKYSFYLSVKIFSKKEYEYYKSIPTLFIENVLKEGINL